MGDWLAKAGVNDGIYYRSHYTPMIGQTWGLLGMYLTNPDAFHRSMEHFKWTFALNHHYAGGFCRCTNLYAYMFYHPSTNITARSAWDGGTEFQTLFYALMKKNLAITGGELHVMGVDRHRLSPSLTKVFDLVRQRQYSEAYDALAKIEGEQTTTDTVKALRSYIVHRADMSMYEIARLSDIADAYRLSEKVSEHAACFDDIGGHASKIAELTRELAEPRQVKEIAIGRELYRILEQSPQASQHKVIAQLTNFIDRHPQSPYVDMAMMFICRKRFSETIPEEILSRMQQIRNRGEMYELSRWMPVNRAVFGENPDYAQRLREYWNLVSANKAEIAIGQQWYQLIHRLRFGNEKKTDKYMEYR
ncbi:MAG: hypothetical protein MI741_13965, partial [Rhodospirillales bacterium]|nr:hypothetical protein [Rhodospirillales bacterium]